MLCYPFTLQLGSYHFLPGGGLSAFWGGQRGDQFFFLWAKGGDENFLRAGGPKKFFAVKIGDQPSQTDGLQPVKNDSSLMYNHTSIYSLANPYPGDFGMKALTLSP